MPLHEEVVRIQHETMRRLIADLTDGDEVYDLVSRHAMTEEDAYVALRIRDQYYAEQRDKEAKALLDFKRARELIHGEEPEEAAAVEVGHKIPKLRGDPLGR